MHVIDVTLTCVMSSFLCVIVVCFSFVVVCGVILTAMRNVEREIRMLEAQMDSIK